MFPKNGNQPRKGAIKSLPVRVFERLTLNSLICGFIISVFIFSGIFYGLDWFFNHGIRDSNDCAPDDYWTYLYFSVVTISSLGYGDYHPVGWGRLAAGIEVVLGLILIAAMVAKIVSEQQSTLMRLLYSSDQERRIKQFRHDLTCNAKQLDQNARDHDHVELRRTAKSATALLFALRSYLIYQINHGILLETGGVTNIRALLECVRELSEISAWIAVHVPNTETATITILERVLQHSIYTVEHVKENTSDARCVRICELVSESKATYERNRKKILRAGHVTLGKDYSEISDYLRSEVIAEWPAGPRPRNLHKRIAKRLGITNGLAARTVDEIESERS